MSELFRKFSQKISCWVGSPAAFAFSVLLVVVWAVLGPHYHYSDTWQLVINTGTTIITFLMVFLIQNTQNRDARAIHLKLDELIRVSSAARNKLIELESLSDRELDELHAEFLALNKVTTSRLEEIERKRKNKIPRIEANELRS